MKTNLKALASLVLISALSAGQAQTASSAAKKHKPVAKKPAAPSVETQIQQLREEFQTQIQTLKQQLSDRDVQLQKAQQQAADAQAAAEHAQQSADAQQAANADNQQAVSSLKTAVTDLSANSTSIVSTIQDNQAQIKKAVETPDVIHYKGVTLSPNGSFLEAATVWRSASVGGDINTPFNGIPFDAANNDKLSEFFGSGRQSRIALLAEGKLATLTMRGYYEADFLSAGQTSNANQSNSYTLRQRQVWAQAELKSGWTFTGGQMWSLATETRQGVTNRTEALPLTIDAAYNVGFVWERQYGFRVAKDFNHKFWLAASAENPETLNVGGSTPATFLYTQPGVPGGLYNPANNYSYNLAPDLIVKVVAEPPGLGHYELFGIARFFRDRVYPNALSTPKSAAGAYNDDEVGGGIGGSARIPTFKKKLDIGLKGLWGTGVGRYGDSTLPDVAVKSSGELAPLHAFSALGTLELHATPRLDVYFNYGGDYVGRYYYSFNGSQYGYGNPHFNNSGCATEPLPGGSSPTFTPSNPGSCSGQNKDIQEFSAGYWYDFYRGPKGRLRQSIQYSHVIRDTWAGVGGAAQGTDDLVFTSFRYYLP